jgi:tRNA/tmRNA/rRNA uracil-C5-methylase (TrmA/RlmC/RlmD family)
LSLSAKTRCSRIIAQKIDIQEFKRVRHKLQKLDYQNYYQEIYIFIYITITHGEFSQINEKQLMSYLSYCHDFITDTNIQKMLIYAAFCILEDISSTRKDG